MYLIFPLEEVRKEKINNFIKNNTALNGINNNNIMNNQMNNNMNMNILQMNMMMPMNGNMMNMNNMNMMLMSNNMMMFNNNILPNNMNMNIPKINSVSLDECFEYYNNKKTIFTGINRFNCKCCKSAVDATQWNTIYSLPDVLVINLNRGKGNQFNVGIIYPENIDLRQYVDSKNDNDNYIYSLKCIVTHLGPSGTSGHYIAFCYVQNKNKWFKFDDSNVSESTFKEASKCGESYILFYQKNNNNQINQINN